MRIEEPKHRRKAQSRQGIDNMVDLAKCNPAMRVGLAQLDARPHQLNTPSGIVDLRTGKVCPNDPAGWHTKIAGCGFDNEMAAPRWNEFLLTTFGGDAELISYVQQLAGYAAIGKVTHEPRALVLLCRYAVRPNHSERTGSAGSP